VQVKGTELTNKEGRCIVGNRPVLPFRLEWGKIDRHIYPASIQRLQG
jgi:hypothetical protein